MSRAARRPILLACLGAATVVACGTGRRSDPGVDDATRAAILRQDRSLEQAELRGDPAAVADHYATDATLFTMSPGSDVHGRAAIEETMRALYATQHTERAVLHTTALARRGSAVVETGRFTFQLRSRAGTVHCDRGSYTVSWKRDPDGVWRITEDRSEFDPEVVGPCPADVEGRDDSSRRGTP